jgi:hypothetical protein
MIETITRPIVPPEPEHTPQCAICMSEFESTDAQVRLGCSHTFHYSCILTWNLQSSDQNHRSCPLCRDDMEVDEILDRRPMSRQPEGVALNRTPIGSRPFAEIVNDTQGIEITCSDCHCEFNYCEMCGIYVCECEYQPNSENWRGRRFHSRANPFGTPIDSDELEEGELPMIHCSSCFENREEFIIDFMMDDHGDIDIFYHERIQELYEEFFMDTSGKEHAQLHQTYPSYTFDEFRDHMTERFQSELRNQFYMDEPIDEELGSEDLIQEVINMNGVTHTRGGQPQLLYSDLRERLDNEEDAPLPVQILNSDISIDPVELTSPVDTIHNISHSIPNLPNPNNPIDFDVNDNIIDIIINYIQENAEDDNNETYNRLNTEINDILNDIVILPDEDAMDATIVHEPPQ